MLLENIKFCDDFFKVGFVNIIVIFMNFMGFEVLEEYVLLFLMFD